MLKEKQHIDRAIKCNPGTCYIRFAIPHERLHNFLFLCFLGQVIRRRIPSAIAR